MPVTDLTKVFGEVAGRAKQTIRSKAAEYIGLLIILCSFFGGLCALALMVEWPLQWGGLK
jgi:hypothetical protein